MSRVSLDDESDGVEIKLNPNQDNEAKLNTGEDMEMDEEVVNPSMKMNALIGNLNSSGFVPLNLSMCDRSMASLKATFSFMQLLFVKKILQCEIKALLWNVHLLC